jgi:DNA-directed RNA polymerase subunit RPC12/RpoP
MRYEDVTSTVEFGDCEGENLDLRKCVCGEDYEPWHLVLGISPEHASACPACGRKFFFKSSIRVFEVKV